MIEAKKKYLGIDIPALPESDIPIVSPNLEKFPLPQEYVWTGLKSEIRNSIENSLSVLSNPQIQISDPPAEKKVDLAVPCFNLAKSVSKNPTEFTKSLADTFNESAEVDYIDQAISEGGYLNFIIDTNRYGNAVLQEIEQFGDDYGNQNIGEGRNIVIDCSGPNVAKFMSVGHLRSTIIGESLARINKKVGYTIIRDNHLGDWGTQFGMLARAHELWADDYSEIRDGTDPVQGLYKLYVRIHEEIEKEKTETSERLGVPKKDVETDLEKQGREWFQRLENGDEKALSLLKWATEQSLHEFRRVYGTLGTKYEYTLGESFYVGMSQDLYRTLIDKKLGAYNEDGALGVTLPNRERDFIIQKKDGTSLYSTRDLTALIARDAWFDPARILYVVGDSQKDYFDQVFSTFNLMTDGESPSLEHIPFGLITLPEGKMSTRAGRVIFLEDVLNESISRAKAKTVEMNRNLSEAEIDTIAQQVGVGAVAFFDLGQNRTRNIRFDWETALSFEGRSAPYIQYAHARAKALLRRAEEESIEIDNSKEIDFKPGSENLLVKHLSKFPEAVAQAAILSRPDIIAEHVYETASLFSGFYRQEYIFDGKSGGALNGRLRLTRATAQVLNNGLDLLCIEAPERM